MIVMIFPIICVSGQGWSELQGSLLTVLKLYMTVGWCQSIAVVKVALA